MIANFIQPGYDAMTYGGSVGPSDWFEARLEAVIGARSRKGGLGGGMVSCHEHVAAC